MLVGPLRTFCCSVQPEPSIHRELLTPTRMFALITVEEGQDAWQTTALDSAPSSQTVLCSKMVPLVGPKEDVGAAGDQPGGLGTLNAAGWRG